MKLVESKIRKWGNSLGMILPKKAVDEMELKENQIIKIDIIKKKGIKVKKIIENEKNTLSTPENCISEIKLWCLANNEDFKKLFGIVKMGSVIEPINLINWLKAAEIRHGNRKEMKDFGLMDSIILAKQEEIKGIILTGDLHFKNKKNVEFLL